MARIKPERVVQAAAAISQVDLGTRIRSAIEKFFVLKALGLSSSSIQTLTAQDVLGACNRLFAVAGRPPHNWYDPLTEKWSKDQPNGGWPVGTVWTQILRPSAVLEKIISSSRAVGGVAQVALLDDYLGHLQAEMKGLTLPAADWAIWLMRDRDNLDAPVFADDLFDEVTNLLTLSAEEVLVLFGGPADHVEVETDREPDTPLFGILLPKANEPATRSVAEPVPDETLEDGDYEWTSAYSLVSLPDSDVRALVENVLDLVDQENLVFPDPDGLIERCIVGLLTGHLILQGPPGTGKTALARLLAAAFQADYDLQTATADWTTYEVIGGLRPTSDNRLCPVLGCVPKSVLGCANLIQKLISADSEQDKPESIARWLIIDELNRADIDRAIGGLYTVLSSTDMVHLSRTPIELWFEEGRKRKLWVPARFRLIGTMNDVDTSFVNALSQGLTRRFQFVYVGVPKAAQQDTELELTRRQAQDWFQSQYGESLSSPINRDRFVEVTGDIAIIVRALTFWLRYAEQDGKKVIGWPLGTAQIADLWRAICLHVFTRPSISSVELVQSFDLSFADRVVPQMATLRTAQLVAFSRYLRENHSSLVESARAVEHLANPQAVR